MITLYGTAPTRATRSQWMLEELGLPYQNVGDADHDSPEFRALNPNGKVPTLVDGDIAVYESMAINLYLARQYGVNCGPARRRTRLARSSGASGRSPSWKSSRWWR